MAFLPRSLSAAVDASNAFDRLSKVFAAEVLKEDTFVINPQLQFAVEVDHATFEWEVSSKSKEAEQSEKKISDSDLSHSASDFPFQVRDLCMNIPRGILVAIIGRVGSGKVGQGLFRSFQSTEHKQSSLLQGLIGEMRKVSGRAEFGGRVAYCQQTAWIQNATLVTQSFSSAAFYVLNRNRERIYCSESHLMKIDIGLSLNVAVFSPIWHNCQMET
jgi:ATP-binding cassette, subfamily C (CFTR/MRP), member 1